METWKKVLIRMTVPLWLENFRLVLVESVRRHINFHSLWDGESVNGDLLIKNFGVSVNISQEYYVVIAVQVHNG